MPLTEIANTQELVRAAFLGIRKYREAKADDGKISKIEIAGLFFSLVGPMKDAAIGIDLVHEELLNITLENQIALSDQIQSELVSLGVSHRTADIANIIFAELVNIAKIAKHISTMPEVAEAVVEPATQALTKTKVKAINVK